MKLLEMTRIPYYHYRQSVTVLKLWLVSSTIALSSVVAVVSANQAPSASSLVGLRNLGNTCYLNSQLQCAYHIPFVRSIVLEQSSLSKRGSDNNDDKDIENAPPPSPGLQALAAVFGDMQAAARRGGAVSPIILTRTLGIPVHEQQDSQEFWKLLLPALHLPRLTDLYQGAFQDYIQAQDGSGRQRCREETFLDISLNVPSQGGSVTGSLAETFGEPELLSVAEGNGWRPAKGEDKVDALKGSRLLAQGLPAILQLHLKRFNYDWNRDVMEKSNVAFSFDDQLDLQPLLCQSDNNDSGGKDSSSNSNCLYDLQAVVIHVGEYNMGHYYAYVRPNLDSDEWFRINDHEIDPVTWQDVLADATGGMVQKKTRNNISSRDSDSDSDGSSTPKRGWLGRLLGVLGQGGSNGSYGFGGSTANAYVLQYVKRSERGRLYKV